MATDQTRPPSKRRSLATRTAFALAVPSLVGAVAFPSPASSSGNEPVLVGRAVLPVATFAGGPQSGAFEIPGPGTVNGVTFPLPHQPVEGFSAIVSGRHPGEYLAMEDNGFGNKKNSRDFLIRAYYLRPHFKTAQGGSGAVDVGAYISFRDPDHKFGFPIVNDATVRRLLTGADIDPESLQRGANGDLWVGEEFGPWILHFDASGRLLHRPYDLPDGIISPDNPRLDAAPITQPSSRGLEGMAITPNGRYLYAALEGATIADANQQRRHIYRFDTVTHTFSAQVLQYRTTDAAHLVADMWALDSHRFVVIERDRGSGVNATFRSLFLVDTRVTDADGFLSKTLLVDLTHIPDPDLVSLPALHPGDLGLGDPFWVMCESVEAVHLVRGGRLLVGCDNNLPNSGRNPGLPDDNEFILVDVPAIGPVP